MNAQRVVVPHGFIQEQDLVGGRCYVLTGPHPPQLRQLLAEHGAQHLRLSRSMGWPGEDLSFLGELTGLRGLDLFHWDVKDVSVLERLPQLELLRLECQFKGLDFTRFPGLRVLSVRWRPGSASAFGCTGLEALSVDGYPEADLAPLGRLARLERLQLKTRALASLAGLEHLPALRHLQLVDCTALTDVGALRTATALQRLELTACKKVGRLDALDGLPQLERLQLENCGSVASVRPLLRCERLTELYFVGTTVADGDLAPLLELKSLRKVALAKSKAHSHTAEQLNQALAARR